jgi:hypothetical protein
MRNDHGSNNQAGFSKEVALGAGLVIIKSRVHA